MSGAGLDSDRLSLSDHEQSTLLDSEQTHSPLSDDEEEEDHARQVDSWKNLPWWKRPSPYWLIFGIPLGSIGYAAVLAPKVALYTTLACRVHKPEFVANINPPFFPSTNNFTITDTSADTISLYLPPISTYLGSLEYTLNDPDSQQKCASDPVVQAIVARLTAVFTTTMGVLTCLTTGWWSSLSDRYGRRFIIFISMSGLFVTDVTHVITAWFVDVLPGGYWFPLVGSCIEGLFGGMATATAVTNTYIADTTDPSTRSRYYSLLQGLSFAGVAVGPVLGGLLIHSTGNVLSAFYFAFFLHTIYICFILFLLPESLTRARARGACLRRSKEKEKKVFGSPVLSALKSGTNFFSPLAIFLPGRPSNDNPLKLKTRDWNLLFIAIAYGLITSVIGSVPFRFQYAAAQFHWTAETTSYFVSCVGITRSVFLTAILPSVINYLKPAPVQLPAMEDEPPRGNVGPASSRPSSPLQGSAEADSSAKRLPVSRSTSFDLILARVSVALSILLAPPVVFTTSGLVYTLLGVVGSLGAGFHPAVHALAIEVYANRHPENRGQVGKLFGALSVVQALASQIISPAMYGFVYSNTVAVFPQAILVVTMCMDTLALAFLMLVRVSSEPGDGIIPGDGNEESQDMETAEIIDVVEDERR